MKLLKFYGTKTLKENIVLNSLIDNIETVYVPSIYGNSIASLKQNCPIWIKRDDCYDVYILTENITEENKEVFINEIKLLL